MSEAEEETQYLYELKTTIDSNNFTYFEQLFDITANLTTINCFEMKNYFKTFR
jgi:hypothetical protein